MAGEQCAHETAVGRVDAGGKQALGGNVERDAVAGLLGCSAGIDRTVEIQEGEGLLASI